jgi:hypothetical protein
VNGFHIKGDKMVKKKKLNVFCSFCNSQIELEIPVELAQNREYYPFEYIDIHGSPQHALMLFLDKHLALRDTMVYTDLSTAKSHVKEFAALVRMSEDEALASIYTDPLRFKILKTLSNGPKIEEELIDILREEKNFHIQNFNTLMIPFIKMGLVKTGWLHNTFYECYFLVQDFLIIRIPAKTIINIVLILYDLNLTSDRYFIELEKTFQEYQQLYTSNMDNRMEEIKFYFELLNNKEYTGLMGILRKDIVSPEKINSEEHRKILQELIDRNFVTEFEANNKKYYALLCDIKIKKFTPNYLLTNISKKLENKEISQEMALKHLDLLYHNEVK